MSLEATSYSRDWLVVVIRWVMLSGLIIVTLMGEKFNNWLGLALFSTAIWNVMFTVLAAINRRLRFHRYFSVGGDIFVALMFVLLSRSMGNFPSMAGLLPLSSAAIYFGVRGVLIIIFLLFIGLSALIMNSNALLIPYADVVIRISFYLGFGLILAIIAPQLIRFLDRTRRAGHMNRIDAMQSEHERNRVIYNLISTLNSSLNYQRVLDTAMDLGYSALAALNGAGDRMVSSVLLYSKDMNQRPKLLVGSARRFTQADMRIELQGTEGLLGRTIDDGEARVGKQFTNDPELSRVVALRTCQSAYCIPLRSGLETYGVLLYAHPDEDFFIAERREILNIIANQAIVAIQNARLYRDLEIEKERIMEIQEEARKKLARDLHDGPTQSVAALAMRVNFARRLIDRDAKAAGDELYKIEDLARRTTKEIRHMLFTLRPLILESEGLIPAIESMADKMRETYNQNVLLEIDPTVVSGLELGKQGVIFYIIEEAITNARKHAQANHTWVRLKFLEEDVAILQIEDDGVGFDLKEMEIDYQNRSSLGMVNLRERTELINGILEIDSKTGKGTLIQVVIPLKEEAIERMRRTT